MSALAWPQPDLAVVRIARTGRGNAFDTRLVETLHAAIAEAAVQPAAQTLVFHAEGPDFSTGMDLSDLESETDDTLAARFIAIEDFLATDGLRDYVPWPACTVGPGVQQQTWWWPAICA